MPSTSRGYPYPQITDDNNPPADIQALADAVNTDMNAQYSAVSAPTVASVSAPAAGTRIIRKFDYVEVTTSPTGVVTVTFDTPFPNGILHLSVLGVSGVARPPVVNSGAISKSAVSLIWVDHLSTAVKFTYEAIGW